MLCSCGSRIPDNVEFCPYCGRRHTIRTRPAQLTGGTHIEPFKGDFSAGSGKTGCVGWFVSLTLSAIILAGILYFLWQDGQLRYLLEWLDSLNIQDMPLPGGHSPEVFL